MTIEDVMIRRDKASSVSLALQKIIGKDSGLWNIEYFENRKDNKEFKEYVLSEMERLGFNVMIFVSWIFTKELYQQFKEYIKFENNNKDGKELFYIFFVELKTFMIFNSKERMLEAISKFSQELKEDSNLNIQNIVECDNGIEVEFFTCVKSIKFEEKPDALK